MKKWRKFGAVKNGVVDPFTNSWWYSDGEFYSLNRDHSAAVKLSQCDLIGIENGVLGFSDEIDDTERLEWMAAKGTQIDKVAIGYIVRGGFGALSQKFETFREAIDDAMRREQE